MTLPALRVPISVSLVRVEKNRGVRRKIDMQRIIGTDGNSHHTASGSSYCNVRAMALLNRINSKDLLTMKIGNSLPLLIIVEKMS